MSLTDGLYEVIYDAYYAKFPAERQGWQLIKKDLLNKDNEIDAQILKLIKQYEELSGVNWVFFKPQEAGRGLFKVGDLVGWNVVSQHKIKSGIITEFIRFNNLDYAIIDNQKMFVGYLKVIQ